jgi:PAT family acetyl-CoA transporter-like MFS transporter 1
MYVYRYGITRDTLALLRLPLLVIHILVPLSLNGTQRPLIWFSRGYILRLISSLILALYIFFTPRIIHTSYFYPVLIILLCLHESFICLKIASVIGFYARISEPRIAGTYMTLLATISNLGHNLSSTLALYIANWLPKSYAYSIEVVACSILGFIWIGLVWNILRRLDGLPVEEWHLKHSPSIHYHLIAEEESEL